MPDTARNAKKRKDDLELEAKTAIQMRDKDRCFAMYQRVCQTFPQDSKKKLKRSLFQIADA